jgi:hypothetical protein
VTTAFALIAPLSPTILKVLADVTALAVDAVASLGSSSLEASY